MIPLPAALRRLALAWGWPVAKEPMHALPDDLAAQLNAAQDALEAATAKDSDVASAQQREADAQSVLDAASEAALTAHQDANAKATAALAALKQYFGV